MRRHLFRIVSAISSLLCIALAVLWPLSLGRITGLEHSVQWPEEESGSWHWHYWQFESACGGLHFMSESSQLIPMISEDSPSPESKWEWITCPVGRNAWLCFPRNLRPYFEVGPKPPGSGGASDWVTGDDVLVFVPYWCVLLVTLPLPASRLFRRCRSARRRKLNSCIGCGYDLRGNISGICPECGRTIQGRHKGRVSQPADYCYS